MSTPNNTSFSLSRLSYFLTFYLYKIKKNSILAEIFCTFLPSVKIFDSSYDEFKDEDQFDINNLSYHNRNNQHI